MQDITTTNIIQNITNEIIKDINILLLEETINKKLQLFNDFN